MQNSLRTAHFRNRNRPYILQSRDNLAPVLRHTNGFHAGTGSKVPGPKKEQLPILQTTLDLPNSSRCCGTSFFQLPTNPPVEREMGIKLDLTSQISIGLLLD